MKLTRTIPTVLSLVALLLAPTAWAAMNVTVYNKIQDPQYSQITVSAYTTFNGTNYSGVLTNGSFYQTNVIATGATAVFGNPPISGGTWNIFFKTLNNYSNAFQAFTTNGQYNLLSKVGPNTMLYRCWGTNWTTVAIPAANSSLEILTIVGEGDPGATLAWSKAVPPCPPVSKPPPMAQYKFHALLASLSIFDTPIYYSTPRGPDIGFRVTYNQKEAFQPETWDVSNLGPKWNLSAIAYIQDDSSDPTSNVRGFPQGGGSELFTGFNTNTSTFSVQPFSRTKLTRTSATSYLKEDSSGRKEIYTFPDTGSTNRRVFLTKIIDATGNEVSFNYQSTANGILLSQVIDALGQTNNLAYNHPTDPLKVTGITDPFNRTAYFGYVQTNGAIRLSSITDPVQIVSAFEYGTGDFISKLITPYGTTQFTYSESGGNKTLMATDPLGQTECLQYQVNSIVTPEVDLPAGMLTTTNFSTGNSYYWDKKAWALAPNDVTQAEVTHWAVSSDGTTVDTSIFTKRQLEGAVWFNYPGQTNANGMGSTLAQPATVGRVLDNGATQKVTISYDGWGNATNAVDAIGRTTRFTYSTNGIDLLEVAQKKGAGWDVVASMAYNAQHLPTTTVLAGVTNSFGYSTNGLLLTSTNGIGQVSTFNYNAQGYMTNIVGHTPADTASIAYDTVGRVYSIIDSEGYSITNLYDNIDRITNSTLPDGTFVSRVYKDLDLVKSRGRDNRWTYLTYDSNRRLSTVQDTAGHLYHYEWCGCGSLESITDPKEQMTVWHRDIQGRPVLKYYADLSAEHTEYENKVSRVKKTTDAAGKIVGLAYAHDNNITNISYSGGPATPGVSFVYDTNYNRLTRLVDGVGTNAITYVPTGQAGAGSVQTLDGPLPSDTITFGYDSLGRPLSVQVGTATSAVQYDTLGRIWWSSNLLGITTVEYVGVTSRPNKITRPNGLITSFAYTPVIDGSRLHGMITTNSTGQVIESFGYAYDIRNLITHQTNVVNGITSVWSYTYDLAQRLLAASQTTNGVPARRFSYAYDRAGNRTSEQVDNSASTETANPLNQLTAQTGGGIVRVAGYLNETGTVTIAGEPARMTSATNFEGEVIGCVGNSTITVVGTDLNANKATNSVARLFTANMDADLAYDKAGNLISKDSTNQSMTFGWDSADRCVAITNGAERTTIAYDGMNRWSRITEYSNAAVVADRRFVWNGTSLAEERDLTGTNVVKRFYSGGFWQQGTNYYYVTDHLGSIKAVTDASGTVVARFEYDPYGRQVQTFGSLKVDYGFAGLFEHKSGLKLAVWRLYDPATGRWLSRDPIREEGGWNLYCYADSDPVNLVDCLGLWATYRVVKVLEQSPEGRHALKILAGILYQTSDLKQVTTDLDGNQQLLPKNDWPKGFTLTDGSAVWIPLSEEPDIRTAARIIHESIHVEQARYGCIRDEFVAYKAEYEYLLANSGRLQTFKFPRFVKNGRVDDAMLKSVLTDNPTHNSPRDVLRPSFKRNFW